MASSAFKLVSLFLALAVLPSGAVFGSAVRDGADRSICPEEPWCFQSASFQGDTILAQANTSKSRARSGDFDETGSVLCAQERGQSLGKCKAAVARDDGGNATVVVTFPNGFARQLYFQESAFVRASTTMSGSGKDIDWSLENDLFILRVDDQRFEVPSSFVLGN